jgi:hypothetical protein
MTLKYYNLIIQQHLLKLKLTSLQIGIQCLLCKKKEVEFTLKFLRGLNIKAKCLVSRNHVMG